MRLAVIDARANPTESNRKWDSDPLPEGAYEQYVIDVEPWAAAITHHEVLEEGKDAPTQLLVIDTAKLPNQSRIVPAWVAVVQQNGDTTPALGVLRLPLRTIAGPVLPHLMLWCKAGLMLAQKRFASVLEADPKQTTARIQYWLAGGDPVGKGWVKEKEDDLRMRILQQWPYWQSPAFQAWVGAERLKEWSAKLSTIKAAGYALALDENRLQVEYGRMGFKVGSDLQKSKKP